MKILGPATEADMVLAFLRAELHSPTYALQLTRWLAQRGCSRALLEQGDPKNETENELRRAILGDWRGYRRNTKLFAGFPDDVRWSKALLTSPELAQTRYTTFSPWPELSKGTRVVADGAENVGKVWLKRDPTKTILEIADAIREGRPPREPLMLVGPTNASVKELVLVEGYKRATAYAYVGGDDEISALIGSTERFPEWTPAL